MNSEILFEEIANPDTNNERYKEIMAAFALELADRLNKLEHGDLKVVDVASTASDFDLVAVPLCERLKMFGWQTRLICVWTSYKIHWIEPFVDSAPVVSVVKENEDLGAANLIIAAQAVPTITELESLFAHLQYDEEKTDRYDYLTIATAVAHTDAEDVFKNAIPSPIKENLRWLTLKTDRELTPKGDLLPGLGMSSRQRAKKTLGRTELAYFPDMFRDQRIFVKHSKGSSLPKLR